jgi:hypothetical protein
MVLSVRNEWEKSARHAQLRFGKWQRVHPSLTDALRVDSMVTLVARPFSRQSMFVEAGPTRSYPGQVPGSHSRIFAEGSSHAQQSTQVA